MFGWAGFPGEEGGPEGAFPGFGGDWGFDCEGLPGEGGGRLLLGFPGLTGPFEPGCGWEGEFGWPSRGESGEESPGILGRWLPGGGGTSLLGISGAPSRMGGKSVGTGPGPTFNT